MSRPPTHHTMTATQELVRTGFDDKSLTIKSRTISSTTTTRTATAAVDRRFGDKSSIDVISRRFFVSKRSRRTNTPMNSTTTIVPSSNKKQALLLAFLITILSITAIAAHGADYQEQGKQEDLLLPSAALSNVPHQHDYHEQEGNHHEQILVNNDDDKNDENSNYSSVYHHDEYGDGLLSDSTIDVTSVSSSDIDDIVPNGRTMKHPPLLLFSPKQRKTQGISGPWCVRCESDNQYVIDTSNFENDRQFYFLENEQNSACPLHHLIISPEECVKAAIIVAKNELDYSSRDGELGYRTQRDSVMISSNGAPKMVGHYQYMPPGCSIMTDGNVVFNQFGKHSTTKSKNVGNHWPICSYFGQNYQNDDYNILPKDKRNRCQLHLRITSEDECRIAGTQMGGRYVNRIIIANDWARPYGCSLRFSGNSGYYEIIYNSHNLDFIQDYSLTTNEICRKDPIYNKNNYGLIQNQSKSGGKCTEGAHVKGWEECEQIALSLLGSILVRFPYLNASSKDAPFGCYLYMEDDGLFLGYNTASNGKNTNSMFRSICEHTGILFGNIYQMLPPDANSVCPSSVPAISQWNCHRAGLSMGGFMQGEGYIHVRFWNHAPPGCFSYNRRIMYNLNPNPTRRRSGRFTPLCHSSSITHHPTNGNYQLHIRHNVAECSMGSAITENQCENAGAGLGGKGYKASKWTFLPSGCSMRADKKIFFNRRMIKSTRNNGRFLPICDYSKSLFEALPRGYSMKCEEGRELFEHQCEHAGQFLTGNKDDGYVNYLGRVNLGHMPPGCSLSNTKSGGIDVVYNTRQNPTNNGKYYPICDGQKYELGPNAVYDPNPILLGRTVVNFDPFMVSNSQATQEENREKLCKRVGVLLGGELNNGELKTGYISPPYGCSIGVSDNLIYLNNRGQYGGNDGNYYPILLRKTHRTYQKVEAGSGSKCDDGMGVSLVDCNVAVSTLSPQSTNIFNNNLRVDSLLFAQWGDHIPPGCSTHGDLGFRKYNMNPNAVNDGNWQPVCEYVPSINAQISTECSTLGFDGKCISLQDKVQEGLHAMFCNKGETAGCTIYQSIFEPLIHIIQIYEDLPEFAGCIGDFKGREMTESDSIADRLGCSNFPVVDDTQYGVIATQLTILTAMQLSLQSVGLWNIPDETVYPSFCLMIKNPSCTKDKNGVEGELGSGFTVGLSFNADTLVTITNIVPAGEPTADYFIALVGKALDAGLDQVTFALSAGIGLEDSVDVYTPETGNINTITYSPNLYIQLAFANIELPFLPEKYQESNYADLISTTTTVTNAIAFNRLSPGDVMGFFGDPIGTAKDAGSGIQAVFKVEGELQINLSYLTAGILADLKLFEAYGSIYVAGEDHDNDDGNSVVAGCYLTMELRSMGNVLDILSVLRKHTGGISGLLGKNPANVLVDAVIEQVSKDIPAKLRLWITRTEVIGFQIEILNKELVTCKGKGFVNPSIKCKFLGLDPFEMLMDGVKFVVYKLESLDQLGIGENLASLNDVTFGKLGINLSLVPPGITFPGFTSKVVGKAEDVAAEALKLFNGVAKNIPGFSEVIGIFKRRRRRFLLERTNIREEDFWSKDEIRLCLQKPYQFGIHATTTTAHIFALAFPVLDPVATTSEEEGDKSGGSSSCPTIASDFLHNGNSELDDVMLSIIHEEEFTSEKVLLFENPTMTLNDFAKAIDSAANKLVNLVDDYHVIHNNCAEFVLNVYDFLKMDYMNEEEVYHRILDYVSSQLASDEVLVGTLRFELLELVQQEQERSRRSLSSLSGEGGGEGGEVAVVDTHSPIMRLLRGGNNEAIVHHVVKSYIDSHHEKKGMK